MAVGQPPLPSQFEVVLKLATEGNARAQFNLGVMWGNGDGGVPQNDAEAVFWYRLATDQGFAEAQNRLGIIYEVGRGVPSDYVEAVKWYRLAADQGHVSAQFALGTIYIGGGGVPRNLVMAYAWMNIAVSQGGTYSEEERGIKEDLEDLLTPAQIAEAQQLSTEIFERIQQGNE